MSREFFETGGKIISSDTSFIVADIGSNGCDSITNISIIFNEEFIVNLEETICFGEVYKFGDTISETGSYSISYNTINGCDSTFNLELEVRPEISNQVSFVIYNDESISDGIVYSESIDFETIYQSSTLCDSIVQYSIERLPPVAPQIFNIPLRRAVISIYWRTVDSSGTFVDSLNHQWL